MQPIEIWIDARDPADSTTELAVFGMGLVERLLRAVLEAGIEPVAATVHLGKSHAATRSGDQGLRRALEARLKTLSLHWVDEGEPVVQRATRWLLLDGTSLVDPRLLQNLAGGAGKRVAWGDDEEPGFAACYAGPLPDPKRPLRELLREMETEGALERLDRSALPSYLPRLRRELTPYCMRVRDGAERDRAERTLFWGNYKGSTDFFTKHVYPPLVWALVRPLARWRVHPNWISGFNVLVTIAAVPLFATGAWVPGLTLAYMMSVLDSVDGKLARLTFRASKLGHVLDHGLDVVHPPFWYAAWAWALDGGRAGPLFEVSLGLAAAYFLDRVVTEIFTRTTRRSIHAYAPADVRMRTWISRRNINVPLFTLGLLLGVARGAFALIVVWQVLTLAFHAVRLVQVNLSLRGSGMRS
jgi:phosphatidylglycerophosphate synthase